MGSSFMKKKIILLIVLFIIAIIGGSFSFFIYHEKQKTIEEQLKKAKAESTLIDIENHFANTVITTNETKLYKLDDKKYKQIGTIGKNQLLRLTDKNNNITKKTRYFYIESLDLYISYKDVKPNEVELREDNRYKNYLLFDENIVSKNNVKLYDSDKQTMVLSLDNPIDVPIIIKDDLGVFVEYFNKLLFIKNEDIVSTYVIKNNKYEETTRIPVTCYHYIYNSDDNTCNDASCLSKEVVESQFNYLSSNNYFTLNTTELRLFIEGKLRLPKNSILVTIDDGLGAEDFIPLLEQYKINATLFLISSRYLKDKFVSPYLEIASHTHDLHNKGVCNGGEGSPLKCLDKTTLVNDLKTSRENLNLTEAFSYPFEEYNDYSIEAVQEAGFRMAFAGGMQRVTRGINLYKIPRIIIKNNMTLNQYINYVK